jgi:hypothetical protein
MEILIKSKIEKQGRDSKFKENIVICVSKSENHLLNGVITDTKIEIDSSEVIFVNHKELILALESVHK